jgi:anti-sigma regulatory factor (Ser/Thr protein kinase)
MSREHKKIIVQRNLKSLAMVREEVRRFLRAQALSWRDESRMVLAVDEAVSNIIVHNNSEPNLAPIEVELRRVDGTVEVVIRDNGRKFNPRKKWPPKLEPGNKRLGLYIISKAADEVRYRFVAREYNELTLVKRTRER